MCFCVCMWIRPRVSAPSFNCRTKFHFCEWTLQNAVCKTDNPRTVNWFIISTQNSLHQSSSYPCIFWLFGSFPSGASPGSDGGTLSIYGGYWGEIKNLGRTWILTYHGVPGFVQDLGRSGTWKWGAALVNLTVCGDAVYWYSHRSETDRRILESLSGLSSCDVQGKEKPSR